MRTNKPMIRQGRLEEQLLAAIEERILNPRMLDHVVARCEEELRRRLAEMDREGSVMTWESLKKDLEDRKRRQAKLAEAIETAGDISVLMERLRNLASEITRLQEVIASYRPVRLEETVSSVR